MAVMTFWCGRGPKQIYQALAPLAVPGEEGGAEREKQECGGRHCHASCSWPKTLGSGLYESVQRIIGQWLPYCIAS